jgi:hypothetical protein
MNGAFANRKSAGVLQDNGDRNSMIKVSDEAIPPRV